MLSRLSNLSRLPTLACLGGAFLLSTLATGCASFKLKDPPPGFIQVSESSWSGDAELRMKAPDNVGLNITTFENRVGGTLELWADDLVKKFAQRGYTLTKQSAVESANGVVGTRFDFRYTPAGSSMSKFYTAVLFVTDEWRVVVQLAGEAKLAKDHEQDLDGILGQIKIRGCKAGERTCKGPQPGDFTAIAKGPKVAEEAEPEPEPEAAPAEESKADDAPAG